MLAEKVNLNVEAIQELPNAYCGIINQPKKTNYNKVVISRVEEIIKLKGETWKNIEKEIGVEKLWNKVHKNPKKAIMKKIADYLDCNVGYFYGMDIDPFYKDQKTELDNDLITKTLQDYYNGKIFAKDGAKILNITESNFRYLVATRGYLKTPIDKALRNNKINKKLLLESFYAIDSGKTSMKQEYAKFNIAYSTYYRYYKAYKNGSFTSDKHANYDQTLIDLLRLVHFNKIQLKYLAEYLHLDFTTVSYKCIQYGYNPNIEQKIYRLGFPSMKVFIRECSNIISNTTTTDEVAKKYRFGASTFRKYLTAYKNGVFKEYNKTGKLLQINPFTLEVDNFTEADLNYDAIKLINQHNKSETHAIINNNNSEVENINKEEITVMEADNMNNNNEDIVTITADDATRAKEIKTSTIIKINIDESNDDFKDPYEIIKCVINTLQKYNSHFNNSIESRINKLEGADKERAAFLIDSVLKSFNV